MEIVYIALLTVVASSVGTLTGFGTSTIMVPVLLLFLPLTQTLLLVGVIHWFGDVWKMGLFRKGIRWRLIGWFGIPGVGLTWLGARLVFALPPELLSEILGFLLIAYVALVLIKPKFKLKQNWLTSITGGGMSGFLAGVFGIGGAVRGAFLSAFDLPKGVYIATAGAVGLVIDSVRIGTYWAEGVRLVPNHLWGLMAFVPASFVGAMVAKNIIERIDQRRFRLVVAMGLLVVGVKLVLYPV